MALVCLCEAVSERKVRRAVEHGACTVAEVGDLCGAGTHCQGCHPTIEDVLADTPVRVPARLAW